MIVKNTPKKIILEKLSADTYFDEDEFRKNVHSFLVLQRMTKKFLQTSLINEKLFLNSLIILLNVFGIKIVNEIFYDILTRKEFDVVTSFLRFLGCYYYADNNQGNRIINDILNDIKHRYHITAEE